MIIRFFDWDQPKNVSSALKEIKNHDMVVVHHEWGVFLAEVLIADKNIEGEEINGSAVRKATPQDREMAMNNKSISDDYVELIKKEVRTLELPMKISDVQLSLDGSCVVVAFVADGRVDFRQLIRNLSIKLEKSVRLQQIGSRDEARRTGSYGICGREICCRKFPGSLKSISTEMARCQLISHRGSERISGAYGRLMCCLAFEAQQYQDALKKLPPKGQKVRVGDKTGFVLDVNAVTCQVRVQLEDGTILAVKNQDAKVIE